MTNRFKQSDLNALLVVLNEKLNSPSSELELDHAACYGGYCLSYKNNQGHRATPRMPIREMYRYLQGSIDYVT